MEPLQIDVSATGSSIQPTGGNILISVKADEI